MSEKPTVDQWQAAANKEVKGKEGIITKTSLMLGLGEQEHEVMAALEGKKPVLLE